MLSFKSLFTRISREFVSSLTVALPSVRTSSTFSFQNADMLWEGVTGPAGSQKRRARGKRRIVRQKIDLNIGQKIGVGPAGVQFPALKQVALDRLPDISEKNSDPTQWQKLHKLNIEKKTATFRKTRSVLPLLRGWTGSRFGGKSIGPPQNTFDYKFKDFDTKVLEFKPVACMTATKGRTRRFSCLVITGNGKGAAGYCLTGAPLVMPAVRKARNRAGRKLEYFNLYEGRTLWHAAFVQERETKIIAKPLPKGYGLICHRCIAAICKVLGITDMHARVEGSKRNYLHITRGFLRLLREQETYQALADREQLHVVQRSIETNFYPKVLASPSGSTRQLGADESFDINTYYMDGRIPNIKPYRSKYANNPGVLLKERRLMKFRDTPRLKLEYEVYNYLNSLPNDFSGPAQSSSDQL